MKKQFATLIFISLAILFSRQLGAQKIKIFVLAGQSNMQGHGDIAPATIPGTLEHFLDNGGDEEFPYIRDGGNSFTTRTDTWVRYDHENGELITGQLSTGFGGSEEQIGPELGFGHLLGAQLENQVLIIKTCWGGKNLAVDFRPPSSGGSVGPYYSQMISDVNEAIDNIATEFPEYDDQEIEIAGLCWFQGWNDGEEEAFLNEYEENLIHLIADLRADFETPNLPVVVGLTGNGGFEIDESDLWVRTLQTVLVPAQISAVNNPDHTNVALAETRGFWRSVEASPEPDFVHHWRNNAESYLRIGTELGVRMIELLDEVSATENNLSYSRKKIVPLIVSPNPASEWIAFPSEQLVDYQIYNSLGQLVSAGQSQIGTTEVNVALLTPGIYHLRLGKRTASFVVER